MNNLPAHSKLGASSYARWKACPGSIRESEGIEKAPSVYAEAGTEAHEKAAKLLLGGDIGVGWHDQEELEAIMVYVDHVNSLRAQKPFFEAVEQKFHLERYHPALFGTADYVCYFQETKTLHVVDFKFGAGVSVEVEDNEQLLYYGVGALVANNFPLKKVVLTIVQPRCYHEKGPVRSWETNTSRILEFIEDLIDDAKKTEDPKAPLVLGDHCRWCPAQAVCPETNKKALVEAQNAFSPATKYDPEKLANTLKALPQIEAWAKAVREFAYREAESGRVPPGFKLVDKRATRKWAEGFKPSDICFKLDLDETDFYEQKLKSIPQIEKIIDKRLKSELEKVTVKESSGRNLVPTEDDRPEIDVLKEAFGKIEN